MIDWLSEIYYYVSLLYSWQKDKIHAERHFNCRKGVLILSSKGGHVKSFSGDIWSCTKQELLEACQANWPKHYQGNKGFVQ